jgi:polygalacturonase
MKSTQLLFATACGLAVLTMFAKEKSAPVSSPASAPDLMNPAVRASFRPALPVIPTKSFDVRHYGAIGDGQAVDTKAIQAAIDAAKSADGGTVVVPAGTYLCGPLRLASKIDLHLEAGAILRMLPLAQYPGGTDHPEDFISGTDLHDIAITGAGAIDGQGAPWWPFARVKGAGRPRLIKLNACERILIAGVTLHDSPMFHIAISGHSTQVTVRGVTIRAPSSTDAVNPSHNTDACDVSGDTVLIEDCDVSVGDDNFTCGGGTSIVLIRHCSYGEGHGVSIGSYTRDGVANIAVVDCTFTHTECGIRIKSDRDRGGLVQHMLYENLRMTDVGMPILIYGAYMAKEPEYRNLTKLTPEIAARYPGQAVAKLTPVYRDFLFRNITATVQAGHRAGLIWGLPEAPASRIRLENVRITADLPFGLYNAEGISLVDTVITTPDGVNKLSLANAKVDIMPR